MNIQHFLTQGGFRATTKRNKENRDNSPSKSDPKDALVIAGYTQLFGGETAECVTHGLQDIFRRIGGVPSRLVFDNASGVGRRVSDNVRMAELFLRFKAHYGFEVTFCNPYAGHEKGNVENKVGYFRRNFFVPLPTVTDIQAFNEELLTRCEASPISKTRLLCYKISVCYYINYIFL